MNSDKREALFEVLVERFEKQRLPRILDIKVCVERGERLSELDAIFLEEVMRDALHNKHLVDDIPECQEIFARVVHLYKHITEKALENEKSNP